MEKQQEVNGVASDSISSVGVTVKDYPPSEVYTSEPPPAYVRPRATAVQIARIAAVTLVAVSFILGFFMLASAYITATATCNYAPQDYPQQESEDRPSFQHLVDPLDSEETTQGKHDSVALPLSQESEEVRPVQIKLPLTIDFDELAGSMMERNQRSRMNCVVEKKRAEEVMDHQPKTVRLPFGVNLTTDPRYEHVTGERMAIFCESGNDQRHVPMEQQVTPIMVPFPVHHPVPMHIPQGIPHHQMPPQQIPPQLMPHHQMMSHVPPHTPHIPPQMPHVPPQIRQILPPMRQMPPQSRQLPPQQILQLQQMQPPQIQQAALHLQQMRPPQQEEPVHIIREEHVIPIFQFEREEPRLPFLQQQQQPSVPSDTVKPPPPPPFHRLPVHIPVTHQAPPQQPPVEMEPQHRPHYVQPRSVRSVDDILHRREKRVRRCACDCAC